MELKFEDQKILLGIAPYRALPIRYAIGTLETIGKFIFELKNGVQISLRFVLIHVELHWAPSHLDLPLHKRFTKLRVSKHTISTKKSNKYSKCSFSELRQAFFDRRKVLTSLSDLVFELINILVFFAVGHNG